MRDLLGGAFRDSKASCAGAFAASDSPLYTRLFWTWLIVRTLVWTAVACLTMCNPPTDTVEMLSWGRELAWGYYKHPPLPAWIAELAAFLAGGSVWGVYLASHIVIGACFWAVWRLGREMLSARAAFFSALALEGLLYYSYMAADINHNVLLAGTWAVTVLCFHRALRTDRIGWWLGLGVAMGLTLLSKYSCGFLFLPMLLFLGFYPACRGCWKLPGPYLAAGVAFLIFLPNLIWCVNHDFGPFLYPFVKSTSKGHSWPKHFWYPAYFAFSQLWRLLPVFLILVPLTSWRWRRRPLAPEQRFDRDFLLALVVGPFALHIVISLAFGVEVRDLWGFHLWTFVGLALLFFLKTRDTAWHFAWSGRLALMVTSLILAVTVAKNLLAPILANHTTQTDFPGEPLAQDVERAWNQCFHQPIPIVASADYFMGSSVSWYVSGRPTVCGLESPGITPWAEDSDLNARGGVILWETGPNGAELPPNLRRRFPKALSQTPVVVPYHLAAHLPPLRVGVAFVPPPSSRVEKNPTELQIH